MCKRNPNEKALRIRDKGIGAVWKFTGNIRRYLKKEQEVMLEKLSRSVADILILYKMVNESSAFYPLDLLVSRTLKMKFKTWWIKDQFRPVVEEWVSEIYEVLERMEWEMWRIFEDILRDIEKKCLEEK